MRLEPFVLDPEALAHCAEEPIHVPGRIQPTGALIALDGGAARIEFASTNAADILGLPLEAVLDADARGILGPALHGAIVQAAQCATDGLPRAVPSRLSGRPLPGCAVFAHRRDGRIVVELLHEPESALSELALPHIVSRIGAVALDEHAIGEGFQELPPPHGDAVAATLANSPALLALCTGVVEEVRRLSGYDRVMFYKFHGDDHGEVIAEARGEGVDTFLGLHYPASDIPPQARALYRTVPLRVLHDATAHTVPIVAAPSAAGARPLDLGSALLRAMSPVHLQYLQNMQVRASLVLSVVVDGRLWGLVACHHRQPHWPGAEVRQGAHLLTRFAAAEIARLQSMAYARARARTLPLQRRLLESMLEDGRGCGALPPQVRGLIPCDGVAVLRGGAVYADGRVPPPDQVHAIGQWLARRAAGGIAATSSLSHAAPEFASLVEGASGALAIDLPAAEPMMIIWFRGQLVRQVRWAGRPEKGLVAVEGVARLVPRVSFAVWEQEARGLADPWTLEDIAMAEAARAVLVGILFDLLRVRQRVTELELLRIRQAVDSVSTGIALLDERDQLVYANPAMQLLLGVADPAGVAGLQLVTRFHEAGGTDTCYRELDLPRGDGDPLPVEVRVDPIVTDAGQPRGTAILVRDLRPQRALEDARRQMEERLLQHQKLESLGVIAGGVAHDFNNLLTAILGNASLLRLTSTLGARERESVDEILAAGRTAGELCRQLLAYAGRAPFTTGPVDVNALVREMASMLRTAIGHHVAIRFDLAATLPAVEADAAQLRQVIMNLIVNAAEAIGETAGIVSLSTFIVQAEPPTLDEFIGSDQLTDGSFVAIEVRDTGSGMSRETRQRIFEPFFTTKFAGRGLGLAAVLGIVRGHRGAIRVESLEGEGTRFTVLLPAAPTPLPAHAPAPPAPILQGADRLVLVIEDDPGVRMLTTRLLEQHGFRVACAEDGLAGLALYAANAGQVALVLLDLTMPRLGGADTLRRLRADDAALPVIVMSGYTDASTSALGATHGNVWFVPKPFGAETMLPVVAQALAAHEPTPPAAGAR